MSDFNGASVLYDQTFDGKGYTNENSLANALLTKPDQIDGVITHLLGKEDSKFPLSFLTEGQHGGSIPVNDVQYDWPVINKLNKIDYVVSTTYSGPDKPGINHQPLYVTFKDNWIKTQHFVESANGTRCRVQGTPVKNGLHYTYTFLLWDTDPAAYVDLTQLQPGQKWGMVGGAAVSESLSRGNASNVVAPGKIKNQLSFLRKSYHIAGNISNKVVECQFNINGAATNLWMAWEQWQHIIVWKQAVEEHLWYSTYNRNAQGMIPHKDPETGMEIPTTAGILQQIPNSDTYSVLTAKKLKTIVRDALFGANDGGKRHIVLFTGTGGREEFDTAMKAEAAALGFSQVQGDQFIRGSGPNLILGGYFATYEHVDGHTITLKHLPLLDNGGRAEIANKHPRTGLPLTSYEMHFIDMSVYEGKRNVRIAHQKERSMITGLKRGMAPVPTSWGGNSENINIATDQDLSSMHFFCSKSIYIRRNTHCFSLYCVAS